MPIVLTKQSSEGSRLYTSGELHQMSEDEDEDEDEFRMSLAAWGMKLPCSLVVWQ